MPSERIVHLPGDLRVADQPLEGVPEGVKDLRGAGLGAARAARNGFTRSGLALSRSHIPGAGLRGPSGRPIGFATLLRLSSHAS